jgi:hypothetical protein
MLDSLDSAHHALLKRRPGDRVFRLDWESSSDLMRRDVMICLRDFWHSNFTCGVRMVHGPDEVR